MPDKSRTNRSRRVLKLAPVALTVTLVLVGCSLTGPDSQTQAAIDAINAIGEVKITSEQSIADAKEAYDALNDSQQGKVDNYQVLADAESRLSQLKDKKAANDKSKADEVAKAIEAIGEVNADKEGVVKQARDSYDALDSDQKSLVSNYTTLTAAETQLEKLAQAFSVGDTITTTEWNVTLTDAKVSHTLESPESRIYYEADEGTCFVILEVDVECLTSNKPTVDGDCLTNLVATYSGNTYSGWSMEYLSGDLWVPILRTYLEANMPCHLYVYTTIPEKALDDDSPVTVDLKVDGQQKTITVR